MPVSASIVIPAFNGQKFLSANLPMVRALGADEIIVVDDASSPPVTAESVKLIRHLQNQGFPRSVNEGVSIAAGEIVILLNQDVKPQKDLLKYTLPYFTDPKVFAVTFNEQDRSWAQVQLKNGFLEFANGPLDNKIHESFWASGGSAAFRKSYWNLLGGFDPIFSPGYFEDLDLGWRSGKAGYKIIWEPKAIVSHTTPESTFNKTYSPRNLQLIKDRNYLLVHWKNLEAKDWPAHIRSLCLRLLHHPGYILPLFMAFSKWFTRS